MTRQYNLSARVGLKLVQMIVGEQQFGAVLVSSKKDVEWRAVDYLRI